MTIHFVYVFFESNKNFQWESPITHIQKSHNDIAGIHSPTCSETLLYAIQSWGMCDGQVIITRGNCGYLLPTTGHR